MPLTDSPANFTPLAALPAVVLDLETTGLDVRRDRIVQIGAVGMLGSQVDTEPLVDRLIDPGQPISAASTRIHGIEDDAVSGAGSFADHVEELRGALAGRVVLGHHIGFDLAVMRHEAARAGIEWADPQYLDLACLCGAFESNLPDLGLESLANWLGVEVHDRHTAIGDCHTTARAFAVLFSRLREADIRTLGEARALCERRPDLVERQERAGWNSVPEEALRPVPSRPMARLDSHVYSRRLDEVMHSPPLTVDPGMSLKDAAVMMVEERVGSLLIVDPEGHPEGILTERDLLRAAATWADDLTRHSVSEAMSSPVESMPSDEMLYRVLGRMTRKGIRHLCVIDASGRAVGIVSQRDLVGHRAQGASALGDGIMEADDAPALAAVHGELPRVAEALAGDGLGGVEVARVVSNEVRALTGRAAEIAEARAEGKAPGRWCVMVLGSAGRGESLLSADQDHALIHSGAESDDAWFAAMGSEMSDLLDHAGIPLCTGGVMCSNTAWRGTLAEWEERVAGWLNRARPEDLLNVDIFFDMVPVAGDPALARDLQGRAVHAAASSPTFIAMLADSVANLTPSLGLFGRLPAEEGRIDLKRHGLLPLVSIARVLAIRIESLARATPDRLFDAAAAERLPESEARRMVRIHRDLMTHILGQQVLDLHNGIKVSSRVEVARLDRETRRALSTDLRDLGRILDGLRGTVSG